MNWNEVEKNAVEEKENEKEELITSAKISFH